MELMHLDEVKRFGANGDWPISWVKWSFWISKRNLSKNWIRRKPSILFIAFDFFVLFAFFEFTFHSDIILNNVLFYIPLTRQQSYNILYNIYIWWQSVDKTHTELRSTNKVYPQFVLNKSPLSFLTFFLTQKKIELRLICNDLW